MTTTSTPSLIKNEDGSYSYGAFVVLAPVYDRSTKKHIFNIIRNGCVPIRHEGNYLTLKSSIKRLTDGVVPSERTEVFSLGEMLGIKPDETVTAAQMLEEITPVFYGPDLITNEEAGFEPAVTEDTHQDSPLMAALKASLEASQRDLLSEEADEKYWVFKSLLDQDLEATRKELALMEVAVAE
jgi:hypothetical protein